MLRFYWSVVRDIPAVMRGTLEAWIFWVASVTFPLAFLFRPELSRIIEGIGTGSRWLALVPVGAALVYGSLRVIHARFTGLQEQVDRLTDRRNRQDALDRLGAFYNHGCALTGMVGAWSVDQWRVQYRRWVQNVEQHLEREFSNATRSLFRTVGSRPTVTSAETPPELQKEWHAIHYQLETLRNLLGDGEVKP